MDLLGPGLTHTAKLTGIDQLTVGRLREFLERLDGVPSNAPVTVSRSDPDRPGDRSMWTISVSWRPISQRQRDSGHHPMCRMSRPQLYNLDEDIECTCADLDADSD